MKRKLEIDELMVESFQTSADAAERGTVRGHEDSGVGYCATGDISNCPDTCEETCALSCYPTCHYGMFSCGAQVTCRCD